MAVTARTLDVEPGSELNQWLEEANGAPLFLIKNGVRFRVERERDTADIWADYDPEKVRQALRESAAAWRGIDTVPGLRLYKPASDDGAVL